MNASGRPVRPPIPNIGRKAHAHIIGIVKRIEPPQSEMISEVIKTTEGTEIKTVVVWKKVETELPIPVRYMWCAHTMNERKSRTITAYTIDL